MSTETMQNIISYVDQYFCDKHTTPSVNEIAFLVERWGGVGIPKTTAFLYWVAQRASAFCRCPLFLGCVQITAFILAYLSASIGLRKITLCIVNRKW